MTDYSRNEPHNMHAARRFFYRIGKAVEWKAPLNWADYATRWCVGKLFDLPTEDVSLVAFFTMLVCVISGLGVCFILTFALTAAIR